MLIKIAHIADLHIGSYQYGIKERQAAHRQTCLKLAEQVVGHNIVLVAGDVFDSPDPSPDDLKCWTQMVQIMSADDAFVIACVGNHDRVIGSHKQWIDIGTDTSDFRVKVSDGVVDYKTFSANGVDIMCFDHIRKREIQRVLGGIDREVDVIMMHQSCGGFLPSIMRPELDLEDLALLSGRCNYLALGDLHVHKIMKTKGCVIAYPGNTDFLRLCDPLDDFKFLSISYNKNRHEVVSVSSVPFEPVQKTQVFQFQSVKSALNDVDKYNGAFNIVRHFPEQSEQVMEFIGKAEKECKDATFHLFRDKHAKPVSREGGEEEVSENTDFIELVEKDRSLEEKDVEIISELWKNPTAESVEATLQQDLKDQTT